MTTVSAANIACLCSSHILQAELVLHGGVRGVQRPHSLRHLLRSIHGCLLPASGPHQFATDGSFATILPVSHYFGPKFFVLKSTL